MPMSKTATTQKTTAKAAKKTVPNRPKIADLHAAEAARVAAVERLGMLGFEAAATASVLERLAMARGSAVSATELRPIIDVLRRIGSDGIQAARAAGM